jgi:thiol-disulfide isomerase/thioredoxin
MQRHHDRLRWCVRLLTASLAVLVAAGIGAFAQGDAPVDADASGPAAHVYYFWGDGCPVCDQQRDYLDWLQGRYPDVVVHAFEVWFDVPNRDLLTAFSDAFGQPVTGVPVTFIGDRGWVGFGQVSSLQMTEVVEAVRRAGGPDAAERLAPGVLERFLEGDD